MGAGKAKSKAKSKPRTKPIEAVEDITFASAGEAHGEAQDDVVVPLAKAKAGAKKKVLDLIGEGTLEEAVAEARGRIAGVSAKLEELQEQESAHSRSASQAQKELDLAQEEVARTIQEELAAAKAYHDIKERSKVPSDDDKKAQLLEAQKKLAMLEVMAASQSKMKLLEEQQRVATEAAEAARLAIQEQKQRERDALEATRAALAAVKEANKRRSSLGAEPPRKKILLEEADTLPPLSADAD